MCDIPINAIRYMRITLLLSESDKFQNLFLSNFASSFMLIFFSFSLAYNKSLYSAPKAFLGFNINMIRGVKIK